MPVSSAFLISCTQLLVCNFLQAFQDLAVAFCVCCIKDVWRKAGWMGWSTDGVVKVGQALTLPCLLTCCVAAEPPWVRYTDDEGRAGYMPWARWKQGGYCGVPRASQEAGWECWHIISLSGLCPGHQILFEYFAIMAFLSRFPWLPVSPVLFSDKELKYHGDKLLVSTKQTGRSASFQHIILHDILSRRAVKAGKTSSYTEANQLSHAVDRDDSVHNKRRISSLRNQKWHAVWCISLLQFENQRGYLIMFSLYLWCFEQ